MIWCLFIAVLYLPHNLPLA